MSAALYYPHLTIREILCGDNRITQMKLSKYFKYLRVNNELLTHPERNEKEWANKSE